MEPAVVVLLVLVISLAVLVMRTMTGGNRTNKFDSDYEPFAVPQIPVFEPGQSCGWDEQCRYGCCESGKCAERCKCKTNNWYNTKEGPNNCEPIYNPGAFIGPINIPGLVNVNLNPTNLPTGAQCRSDTSCAGRCCQSGSDGQMRCAEKCQCWSNPSVNKDNGCLTTTPGNTTTRKTIVNSNYRWWNKYG